MLVPIFKCYFVLCFGIYDTFQSRTPLPPPQVTDTLSTAEALLGELAGFPAFRREASELRDELRDYQREQVNSWSRQVLAAIDHPSEPLRLVWDEMLCIK